MNWSITAKYHYPGPVFYKTDLVLLEQQYPYYRVLGQGFVEVRVNGVGTCYSRVSIYSYGQCGLHTLTLSRHWKNRKAQGNKAKAWCEYIMRYPPRHFDDKWDTSTETLNTVCKQQMAIAFMIRGNEVDSDIEL